MATRLTTQATRLTTQALNDVDDARRRTVGAGDGDDSMQRGKGGGRNWLLASRRGRWGIRRGELWVVARSRRKRWGICASCAQMRASRPLEVREPQ